MMKNSLKQLHILYEDNHLLVVEKPVGLLSQADQTGDPDLLTLLKAYLKVTYNKPGNVFLGLVHRLDRMVGGLMVFAKTSKAASRLSLQIRERQFIKKYLAVVHGQIASSGTLTHYLYKNQRQNIVQVVSPDHPQGKLAELSFKRIATFQNLSLVDIDLKTGRAHQIRVQFAHSGHPLYGDRRYGKKQDEGPIALYAYHLSFLHPTKKEMMAFTLEPHTYPFTLFTHDH